MSIVRTHCEFCGLPLGPLHPKGHKKRFHPECAEASSKINQLKKHLEHEIIFDPKKLEEFLGELAYLMDAARVDFEPKDRKAS